MKVAIRFALTVRFLTLVTTLVLVLVPSAAQNDTPVFIQFAWSADGAYIAAVNRAEAQSQIVVFTADLKPIATLQLTNPPEGIQQVDVFDVAWSPDGTRLASTVRALGNRGGLGIFLLVWNTADWSEELRVIDSRTGGIVIMSGRTSVAWNASGTMISTGSTILDAETGQTVRNIVFGNAVYWVKWHPTNPQVLFLGTTDSAVAINALTGESLGRYPYYYSPQPDVSPDGQRLAVMSSTEDVARIVDIVDTATFQYVTSIRTEGSVSENNGIDWLSNNLLSLTIRIGTDESMLIYDITTGLVVDTVATSAFSVWNEQGTQFVTRRITIEENEVEMAVFDGATEGLIAQYSDQPTVRSLAVTDASGITTNSLFSGAGINNDIITSPSVPRTVQAFTFPESVGSVLFDVNGTTIIDNDAPYTIPLPPVGTYTLTATPYSLLDAQGDAGIPLTVNFTVVEGSNATATPTVISTSTNTPTFTPTSTETSTSTPTNTATNTSTPTFTPTFTETPTETATNTPNATIGDRQAVSHQDRSAPM